MPGDMLCEQVVASSKKTQTEGLFSSMKLVKGSFVTQETAKAFTNCGLLQVKQSSFEEIGKIFAENGEKDKIITFERIIGSNVSKKDKFKR